MDPQAPESTTAMHILAPAKINLHLRVGPPTADGFHPLSTWMCTVSLFDTLTIVPVMGRRASSPAIRIRLTCDDPALPCDATNLVVRAGMLLGEASLSATREGGSPVEIALQKRIPSGAGLGGGSSDGAFAMIGLNRIWSAGLDMGRLAELSSRCGSDLPFFFYGSSSICTGRGEQVRPGAPPRVARWGVLMLPKISMPTPAVYRRFDEMSLGDSARLRDEPDWNRWSTLPATELLPLLVNDLEAPAFDICPELGRLRIKAESILQRTVRMSGSGSSLFTLYDHQAESEYAAQIILEKCGLMAMAIEIAPEITDDLNGPPKML